MSGYLFDPETNEIYLNHKGNAKHQDHCVIIKTPKDLNYKYGLRGLIKLVPSFSEAHGKPIELEEHWTIHDLIEKLWQLFKEITDEQDNSLRTIKREARVKVSRESRADRPNTPRARKVRKARSYSISLAAISQELHSTRGELPPQARTIIDHLSRLSVESLTEPQVRELVESLRVELKTRQDPWRIFRYYEAQLERYGFIQRVYLTN